MELLSNLVWIVVALALWGLWLASRRRARGGSPRIGIGVQAVSLAVLTLILLPVISVSDDLQASHNPAEVERSCNRNDQHDLQTIAGPTVPAALAAAISGFLPIPPGRFELLRAPSLLRNQQLISGSLLASRAPPAA